MEPDMAEGTADVCVCVLFYGNDATCFKLAQRVLNEPMRQLARYNVEFRFGCNAVSDDTRQFLQQRVADTFKGAVVIDSADNAQKYPMMRRLFYTKPVTAPVTVWFDDDSCLAPNNNVDKWLPRLQQQLRFHAMVGSIYRTRLVGNQAEWIKNQAWYSGKEPQPYVQHAAGSWWAAQTPILQRFDWPPDVATHRGVDVMFGELCRQQDLVLCHFRDGVWINANADGVEAAGSQRGKDETPIGFSYQL
jgi:hypothetical protein